MLSHRRRALLGLALSLSCGLRAGAQEPLRIVGPLDLAPLSYLDGTEPRGFDVDVARAIGEKLGRPTHIELMPAAAALDAVLDGTADAHLDLATTPGRRNRFDFSTPTITHQYGIFVRAGETVPAPSAVARVGVRPGGFTQQLFRERSDLELVPISGFDEGFDRLRRRTIDGIATEIWGGAFAIQNGRIPGVELQAESTASFPAGLAVRKGNTALLADIDRAVAAMQADGTLRRIERQWRPARIVLTSRGTLQRVAIWSGIAFLALVGGAALLWARTLRREIRERRRAQDELLDANQRLTLALFGANMATWRWSAKTGLWTRDGSLNRMLGRGDTPTSETIPTVLQAVHPEDRERMNLAFTHAVETCGVFMHEYRVLTPDGTRTMRTRGRVFPGPDGKAEYASGVVVDITSEVDAARKDRLLTHALQMAPDGIVIADPGGAIIYANPAFLSTYEYEEPDVLGQDVRLIRAEGERLLFAPIASNTWRGEVMHRSKSGRIFPVSMAMSAVRDSAGDAVATVAVLRDITRERQAHDALRASEEKFSRIFEGSPDAISIAALSGEGLLMVNEAFEQVTGYARHEVLGRMAVDLGIFPDAGVRESLLARALAGRLRDVEVRIRRKDDVIITALMSGAHLELDGRPCILTVARDISERKRLELQMRQATEANRLLLSEMDLGGLSVATLDALHNILPLNFAALALQEPGATGADVRAWRGDMSADLARSVALSVAAQVAERQSICHITQDAADMLPSGIQTLCGIPLTTSRGSLGSIVVGAPTAGAFGHDEERVLQQMAGFIGIAVQNARAFEEIRSLKDRLSSEKLYLEEEIRLDHNFADIVGESAAIRRVLQQIETVAPTDASVLILGETGTGKELIARAVHNLSERRDRTFVKVNVAALPTTLLESELFGYERGAFTGATTSKVGRMELAHRGTLFLDEVGDVPLEMQPKLLRALQEREFERLGSTKTIRTDTRLIAATNRDLSQMVASGAFRSDLFYRLNVFPVQVPALRERREDIPLLVRYFVQKFATRLRRPISSIPTSTMTMLQAWHWPGNIRELENVIERAVILSTGEVLQIPSFDNPDAPAAHGGPRASNAPLFTSTDVTFTEAERQVILTALRDAGGIIAGPAGAAARLGIKRTTLHSKMRRLGIKRPSFD